MNYEISRENGISDYYYCESTRSVEYKPHIHSHIEFVYVLDGYLKLSAFGQNLQIPKNNVAVITPYEIHSYKTEKDTNIFILACPPEYITEYKQIFSEKSYSPIYSKIGKSHLAIIEDIIKDDFKDNLKKKSLIYSTLSDFINNVNFEKKQSFDYDLYRKAVNFIAENYTDETLTLSKTANHTGVTASHLSRVLNSDGKPGFSYLVNSLRSYSAKQMLEEDDAPIAEIALSNGFGSIRNFNRIFKQHYLSTPREIRKAKQEDIL